MWNIVGGVLSVAATPVLSWWWWKIGKSSSRKVQYVCKICKEVADVIEKSPEDGSKVSN